MRVLLVQAYYLSPPHPSPAAPRWGTCAHRQDLGGAVPCLAIRCRCHHSRPFAFPSLCFSSIGYPLRQPYGERVTSCTMTSGLMENPVLPAAKGTPSQLSLSIVTLHSSVRCGPAPLVAGRASAYAYAYRARAVLSLADAGPPHHLAPLVDAKRDTWVCGARSLVDFLLREPHGSSLLGVVNAFHARLKMVDLPMRTFAILDLLFAINGPVKRYCGQVGPAAVSGSGAGEILRSR